MQDREIIKGNIKPHKAFTKPAEPRTTKKSILSSMTWYKQFDLFGEQPKFTFNGDDEYKTPLGFFCSLIAYTLIIMVIVNYATLFFGCTQPNVYQYKETLFTDKNTPSDLNSNIIYI